MKLLFLGLGSIGRRHLRLLQERSDAGSFSFYALRSGKSTAAPQEKTNYLPLQELSSWSEVDAIRPDIAFICNPTDKHVETAIECARRNMALFLEKPIGNSLEGIGALKSLLEKNNTTAYLAYNFRFHPGVILLRNRLEKIPGPKHARAIVSSYLPDWRPQQKHLESYSASRSRGGGVILDLSHELDLMNHLLGPITKLEGFSARLSNITVDAEDFADIALQAGANFASVHMNFFSPLLARTIEVDAAGEYLKLDLIAGKLLHQSKHAAERMDSFSLDRDESYRSQLDYFLSNWKNPQLMNNFSEALPLFQQIIKFREESRR